MKLHFSVAQEVYCVEFQEETAPYQQLLPSSAPFFVKEHRGELIFHLLVGDTLVDSNTKGFEEVGHFDNGDLWHHVWRMPTRGYHIHIADLQERTVCRLETDADFSHCRVTLIGDTTQQAFGLDNAIMIAFAFAGAYHRLLLIHASVPVVEGRAYLFQGKSGTGKSTHCRLWLDNIAGATLLNDDNPVVRLEPDGSVGIYGSPWSGKTHCYKQERAVAGGFLRLHQAPHNAIRPLSNIEAFASLLSSTSTMVWDKPSYTAICDTVNAVIAQVQSFDLECLPDAAAAHLSHATMTQAHGKA